ncbi:hypothetical protein KS419_11040 [Bacillus tamaricis]|uniref:Uncharacterized protein n=1 Tax=Evansella tamaricis TaxID=2069301 RepID=A0ABS6JF29_9BACI|nr:hypothetical protein [Evansella tamaricis]
MQELFLEDKRLGINLPKLEKQWDGYSVTEQSKILSIWEKERAKIPDRIKDLENIVKIKTNDMLVENDEEKMVKLNNEIMKFASIINDLNIWYRIEPTISKKGS